ncbi:Bifunctional homocysteine S-methyltransferase/5,10-methylenetetrahydrofolate reductase [Anaerolineales bacterium]|nr:Bifunctional homocysteine S-methyltransferase/5,10-methylenetetrahydrofolate reductase [Anaerolineales bacterium]
MPIFTPGRRWQPPFIPFKKEPFNRRALAKIEIMVKGPLFGCRMCGNCLLQETAFICPMECPKGLRNGPCGGSTPERCYVDETRPCIWYKIYERSFKMGREEMLLEVLPPLDWEKTGTETWGDVADQVKKVGVTNVVSGLASRKEGSFAKTWDSIFRPVRQPDWWKGDSKYHPPAYTEPVSELERRLKAGEFVVAAEIAPPISATLDKLKQNIEMVKPYVTAINFTDSPSATPRMSSWACSKVTVELGAEPVMQIAARDRTRVGLQSEVIGASALGVRNILCITGDSMVLSPTPRGRMDIVDVDSVQMLWILRRLRDEGKYLDGREIKTPPKYFLGAAASPFASEMKFQALREEKKVNAGAQFFQTNVVLDADALDEWLNEIAKRNILDKVFIMIGLTPLKNYKTTAYMHSKVPGVFVPEKILKRMETAKKKGNEQEEGVQITLELIEKIKTKQGVHGVHIMAVGWEEIVPRIVKEAGLERK